MQMIDLVRAVISTLNDVEVKGKANLEALLGSIKALDTVVEILEMPKNDNSQCVPEGPSVSNKEEEVGVNGR